MTPPVSKGTSGRTGFSGLLIAAALVVTLGAAAALVVAAPAGAQDGPSEEPVALSFESQVGDVSTEELTVTALATLGDPRSWGRAGFTFASDDASDYRVLLVESEAAAGLCGPNDLDGPIGCQNGAVVVLDAASWREPAEGWDDASEFRQYLINHEVGHLIGQFHPENRCPAAGEPESAMAPQFEGLEGCQPNPWPLDFEVSAASTRPVSLAPAPDAQPESPSVNPGGQTTPTAPGAKATEPVEAGDSAAAEDTPAQKPNDSGDDPGPSAVPIVLGIAVVLVLAVLAGVWVRRRRARADASPGDEDVVGFDDLGDGGEPEFGDTLAEPEAPASAVDDAEFVPLGVGVGVPEVDEGTDMPVWTVRVSGAARQDGPLAWLVPHRWVQGEVAALTNALEGLVATFPDPASGEAPKPERVGEVLAEFLRDRPHLAPAGHEGIGITLLSGDQVVAVALGAAEVIELRNGLAKPVRRQGAMRLRHTEASPLEVEVSVPAPSQPRARIVVERSDGSSSPT